MATVTELKKLLANKAPKQKNNYVGVEIEFYLPAHKMGELNELLIENDLEDQVTVKNDESLRGARMNAETYMPDIGKEIAILAKEDEIENIIIVVCQLVRECDGYVNATCGLHVHLDMRNRNPERCYENLFFAQRLMFKTQPKNRRDNKYCRRNVLADKTPSLRQEARRDERRKAINYGWAYQEHKTIEIRLHEGTLNSKSIRMWVQFLIHVINMKKLEDHAKTFRGLGVTDELRRYLSGRATKFAGE